MDCNLLTCLNFDVSFMCVAFMDPGFSAYSVKNSIVYVMIKTLKGQVKDCFFTSTLGKKNTVCNIFYLKSKQFEIVIKKYIWI